MLRVRGLGVAAFDTAGAVLVLEVTFVGFADLVTSFVCFSVMYLKQKKKRKRSSVGQPLRKPRCLHRHHCSCDGIDYRMKRTESLADFPIRVAQATIIALTPSAVSL